MIIPFVDLKSAIPGVKAKNTVENRYSTRAWPVYYGARGV